MIDLRVDLDELERLHADATPEPWGDFYADVGSKTLHPRVPGALDFFEDSVTVVVNEPIDDDEPAGFQKEEDQVLVIAARNALPALIAELRALRRLRDAVEWTVDCARQCASAKTGVGLSLIVAEWDDAAVKMRRELAVCPGPVRSR